MNSFANELRRKLKQALLDSPSFRKFAEKTSEQMKIQSNTTEKGVATSNEFTRFISLFWSKLKDEVNKVGPGGPPRNGLWFIWDEELFG